MKRKKIILIGGGHAHALALLKLKKVRIPDMWQITLISRERFAPYSGMLPGYIAKTYAFEDLHIDLQRLAHDSGVTFLASTLERLRVDEKRLHLTNGESLDFDVLSLNTGAEPMLPQLDPGLLSIGLKPLARAIEFFAELDRKIASQPNLRLAVIGGGAGGVEVALALRQRYGSRQMLCLLTRDKSVLQTFPVRVQNRVRRVLERAGIDVRTAVSVTSSRSTSLIFEDGCECPCDVAFFATGSAPSAWLADTGLAQGGDGFISINQYLQSTSHPFVFATGDVASFASRPLAKAGVYAVRQAPILAHNLIASMHAQPYLPYRPQSAILSLLNTQDGKASLSWRGLSLHASVCWWLKDFIDRRFMAQFKG